MCRRALCSPSPPPSASERPSSSSGGGWTARWSRCRCATASRCPTASNLTPTRTTSRCAAAAVAPKRALGPACYMRAVSHVPVAVSHCLMCAGRIRALHPPRRRQVPEFVRRQHGRTGPHRARSLRDVGHRRESPGGTRSRDGRLLGGRHQRAAFRRRAAAAGARARMVRLRDRSHLLAPRAISAGLPVSSPLSPVPAVGLPALTCPVRPPYATRVAAWCSACTVRPCSSFPVPRRTSVPTGVTPHAGTSCAPSSPAAHRQRWRCGMPGAGCRTRGVQRWSTTFRQRALPPCWPTWYVVRTWPCFTSSVHGC